MHLEPGTLPFEFKAQSLNPKTRNPKPKTQSPKPKSWSLKPQSQTLNHNAKLQTQTLVQDPALTQRREACRQRVALLNRCYTIQNWKYMS